MAWEDEKLIDDLEMFLEKKKKRRDRYSLQPRTVNVIVDDEYERISDNTTELEQEEGATLEDGVIDEQSAEKSVVEDRIMDERSLDALISDRRIDDGIPKERHEPDKRNEHTRSVVRTQPLLKTPPLPEIILQLANLTDEGIIILQDSKIRYVNQRTESITGFPSSQLLGSLLRVYVIPEHIPLINELKKKCLVSNDVLQEEIMFWKKDGSRIQVEVKAGKITFSGRTAILMMIQDRTTDREQEQTLSFSTQALKELATYMTRSLVTNVDNTMNVISLENTIADREANGKSENGTVGSDIEDMGTFLRNALEACSILMGAGKGLVMEFTENGRKMDCTFEWCSSSTISESGTLKDLDTTGYPWLLKKLGGGNTIRIQTIDEMPPDASSERTIFGSRGIRSILIRPLFTEGMLCGYAEFDFFIRKEGWKDQELHYTAAWSSMISAYLERIRFSRRLQKMTSRITSIIESIPMMSVIIDNETKVRECNLLYANSHGLEKNEVIGRYLWEPFDSGNYERISDHVESAMDGIALHKDIQIFMNGKKMILGSRFIPLSATGGVLIIMDDRTMEKVSKATSMIMKQGFHNMIEMLEGATMMVDGTGDVIAINQTAKSWFGDTGEGLVGLLVFESSMRGGTGGDSALETIINSGEPLIITEEATGITYEINVKGIFDDSGKVAYLIINAKELVTQ